MVPVSSVVEEIVTRSPYLIEAMSDGLVNLSGLARYIKKDVEDRLLKDVQLGTLVMALKRLQAKAKKRLPKRSLLTQHVKSVSVRSNLVEYTYRNSDSLIECEQQLLDSARVHRDSFVAISQGLEETTIITQDEFSAKVANIFVRERLVVRRSNLSSLSLKLSEENLDTPGIYYLILRPLAWEGINLVEVISTTNEMTIVVDSKDIDRIFSTVKRVVWPSDEHVQVFS